MRFFNTSLRRQPIFIGICSKNRIEVAVCPRTVQSGRPVIADANISRLLYKSGFNGLNVKTEHPVKYLIQYIIHYKVIQKCTGYKTGSFTNHTDPKFLSRHRLILCCLSNTSIENNSNRTKAITKCWLPRVSYARARYFM